MEVISERKNNNVKKFEGSIENQKVFKRDEEEGDPFYISFLWGITSILLITADAFEIFIGLIGISTAGALSALGFLPLIFEFSGALGFLFLVLYYIEKKYISPTESSIFLGLIIIEFFGFIPLIGSLIEIFPLKTLAILSTRFRLYRLRRLGMLREFKKKIEVQ